jgi:uncharacterized coiled-coil protein SlyX
MKRAIFLTIIVMSFSNVFAMAEKKQEPSVQELKQIIENQQRTIAEKDKQIEALHAELWQSQAGEIERFVLYSRSGGE